MTTKPKEPSKSKKRPSFFKIMYGDFCNTLKLPLAFTERFEAELKTKSILKDPTGTRWYVKLKKIEDHLVIQNNWPRFVESNSLQYGDVLFFTYIGDSRFIVKIYDRTECEKDLSLAKNVSLEQSQSDDLQEKDMGRESAPVAVNAQNTSNQKGVSGNSTIDSAGKSYQINDRDDSCHKETCQVSKLAETKRPSVEILRQCGTPAANSRPADTESSCMKKRKLSSENAFLSEDQGRSDICLGRSKPTPGQTSLRQSRRLLEHRKAAKMSKGKESYQRELVDSDVELIIVDSDSESEERVNNLQGPAFSGEVNCVISRAASLVDVETESHGSEVECRKEESDELESPILEESLGLPVVKKVSHRGLSVKKRRSAISQDKEENSSYEIPLSQSYVSRGFLYVPMKMKTCLRKIPVGESISKRETVRLWISDDRSWPVRFSCMRKKAYFLKGWNEFLAENNLVQGDVCIFQLMKTGKRDIRVSVRRLHQQLPLPS